ncbi:alpha/beta hydrolase-fold protein [Aureibaculum sp. 2210JD6-5]|uniref:alpha/beta hydrolase n=1 Tax=Aureibaculum sp. 2210JD6-5 TaxID=3103957 RepID=UPI002AADA396|nr:alpha/beta hydrolase-fold protein [Aureibaculum sp. 2210JD6-5]MDY7396643.1 alpha/beta hydrolase-fold protein [Aureibaculum sp. 2210JD6-5]
MSFNIDFISLKGDIFSKNLGRKVKFRLMAPGNYRNTQERFPVLLMNDGQDFKTLDLEKTISDSYFNRKVRSFVYVGVETNENRIHEYGTASSGDFKGRGKKAVNYSRFIIEEFIPFLKAEYKVSYNSEDWVYAGMSLGGLSAFDIVFNHPQHFSKVGVFSGSFWWRKKAYVKKDLADRSRIILDVIKNGIYSPHLKFWLQVGTLDESADRNNNGIIDAIDDTKDVIKELVLKGYTESGDITYVEVINGKHDLPTWGKIFPEFIRWAFGNEVKHILQPENYFKKAN